MASGPPALVRTAPPLAALTIRGKRTGLKFIKSALEFKNQCLLPRVRAFILNCSEYPTGLHMDHRPRDLPPPVAELSMDRASGAHGAFRAESILHCRSLAEARQVVHAKGLHEVRPRVVLTAAEMKATSPASSATSTRVMPTRPSKLPYRSSG